ncbi:MAG: phosphomethylpyrimidine synthase ThiC [Tannerella sp.]|jgi:phosphomethylpyrimidine synthase|nr:phosphomethylpyrimidine synthase ThiC [Tannerella sp.]
MKKIYIEGEINNVRVGMCQINLSDTLVETDDGKILKKNNPVVVYDTSGPYGDRTFNADFSEGLPRIRKSWYTRRKDIVHNPRNNSDAMSRSFFSAKEGKCITQMFYAKKRMITPEMEYVAIRENQQIEALGLKSYITPDFVRKEIASGRAVIPANINHLELEPMIIGSRFLVKINGNIAIGKAFSKSDAEKVRLNCCLGVDTLMDISREASYSLSREYLVRNSPVPVGTLPLYHALAKVGGRIEDLSWDVYRSALTEQLMQGVDFVSVHAAMKRKHLKMTTHRLTGIVSRAGRILAEWMSIHKEENFLNTHFPEICEIVGTYDAVISLGSGLRPGSIYDSNDKVQYAELTEMRELVEFAWENYVQVMAEGPGHVPMNKIEPYMKEYRYVCKGVPFFSPGMVTSDLAVGHEHIAAAIGGAQMAWYGASLIGGLKSQVDITDPERIRTDLLSYKIAAHSADLAKGHPGAQVRDNAFSKAKQENRETDWRKLSLSAFANL